MQLSKQEIIALRESFLFHHMSPGAYVDFTSGELPNLQRISCAAGAPFSLPQGPENSLAILISGQLYASRAPRFPDQQLREGFVIGALDLFSSLPPSLPPIHAVEDSQLLCITVSQMKHLFAVYPELMLQYIQFLTGQVHALRWEHTLATTSSGETRLLQFLGQHLSYQDGTATVTLPYSFSVLAGRLNMSRASLYRAFDHLEETGLLERQGKLLIIRKPELLPAEGYI
jgi:CRP-like cAMP-binding protein